MNNRVAFGSKVGEENNECKLMNEAHSIMEINECGAFPLAGFAISRDFTICFKTRKKVQC